MKLVREYINEKFIEDSDPIQDMGIGIIHIIKEWLKKHKITNYTLNDDLTIDVNDTVILMHFDLKEFPNYIQFGMVNNFIVENSNFISFKGFPKIINGVLNASENRFESLEYFPKIIKGTVYVRRLKNGKIFEKDEIRTICKCSGKIKTLATD